MKYCICSHLNGSLVFFFPIVLTLWKLSCLSFFCEGANGSIISKFWMSTKSSLSLHPAMLAYRVVTIGSSLAIVWPSMPASWISSTDLSISSIYVLIVSLFPCKAIITHIHCNIFSIHTSDTTYADISIAQINTIYTIM